MKQITLKLNRNYQRPVVVVGDKFKALFDTGAFFPVWVAGEKTLKSQGAELIKENVPFSGFGGTATGNLYRVTFQVGELVYPSMPILANSELDVTFDVILSASMFDGLIYQVDTVNHVLTVEIPDNESTVRNIKLRDSSGRWFVLSGDE